MKITNKNSIIMLYHELLNRRPGKIPLFVLTIKLKFKILTLDEIKQLILESNEIRIMKSE